MGYGPWGHEESDTTEQLTHTYSPVFPQHRVFFQKKTVCDEHNNFLLSQSGFLSNIPSFQSLVSPKLETSVI